MITPEIKDKILNHLVDSGVTQDIEIGEPIADIPWEYASIILKQIIERNLATIPMKWMSGYTLELSANAFDFQSHGGFAAE